MKKTFLSAVGVFAATLTLCLGAFPAYAATEVDCSVQGNCYVAHPLSAGSVIRFDNSKTKWSDIRIYFWENGTDSKPFEWDSSPYMTQEEGDIYKYVLSGDWDWARYSNYLIRGSGENGAEQTIDLSLSYDYEFYGNKREFVFKPTTIEYANRYKGYWYEKDERVMLANLLNSAKEYVSKIDCSEDDEAKTFVNLVNEIDGKIEDEFVVHTNEEGPFWSWTYSSVDIDDFSDALDAVVEKYGEEPTVCEEDDTDDESGDKSDDKSANPDTFDTIGLFAGLGVASFAGLAIALNRKRRA